MLCPRCSSSNVRVQVITHTKLVRKYHGFIWWLLVGWWWVPVKWLVFTPLALLAAIFAPKRMKLRQRDVSVCVCQNCGNNWHV